MPFRPDYDVPENRRPYTLKSVPANNSDKLVGVLIIHGFMGSPLSSRPMAEYLNSQRMYIHCPLLPGHGQFPDKLRQGSKEAWLAEVEEAYHAIRSKVDELFIIAHSMGNILASHVVLKYKDIRGMVMLAPVYDVPDKRLKMTRYARHIMKWYYPHKSKRESMQILVRERVMDFDPTIDYDSAEFQAKLPEMSRVPIAGMYEMVRTIKYGRNLWSKLNIPVRIHAGEEDSAAPPENARQIYNQLQIIDRQLTIYPQTGHELMRPFAHVHQKVWQAVSEFISTTIPALTAAT